MEEDVMAKKKKGIVIISIVAGLIIVLCIIGWGIYSINSSHSAELIGLCWDNKSGTNILFRTKKGATKTLAKINRASAICFIYDEARGESQQLTPSELEQFIALPTPKKTKTETTFSWGWGIGPRHSQSPLKPEQQ